MDPVISGSPHAPLQQSKIEKFGTWIEKLVPDAISSSVIMAILLFAMALAIGVPFEKTFDAYYKGLWSLLAFTMQMTLIVTLSAVFGATPLFRKGIMLISRLPKTPYQVVLLAVIVSLAISYLYWGLGITLGPVITVYFCKEAERRGIKVDFIFTLATSFAASSVWQYGLSSSPALLMATPGNFLEKVTGVMPLSSTIWSFASVFQELAFSALLILAARFLMPKNPHTIAEFPESERLVDEAVAQEIENKKVDLSNLSLAQKIERSPIVIILLSILLVGWLYYNFFVKKLSLDLNSLNVIFLLLGLILHRNVYNFTQALQNGIKSAWSVVVIYGLYAGVAGLIQYTDLGNWMAGLVAGIASRYTLPLLVAIMGTVVAVFVPSSGGQWVIQGFVTSKAAAAVGMSYQRGLLALSVGDQMGNLVAPFWYVVIAGIARVDFRKLFGYGLIYSAIWFILGVLTFTFLPV